MNKQNKAILEKIDHISQCFQKFSSKMGNIFRINATYSTCITNRIIFVKHENNTANRESDSRKSILKEVFVELSHILCIFLLQSDILPPA